MKNTNLPTPFTGIITPMITPLSGQDKLDITGLERLIEHILAGGVHGLFILGTTGEAPSLSHRLRRELIQHTSKIVNERIPILVGITDTSFVESISMATFAASHGASAVVSAPPYYFPAGQPELLEYVQHLARQLPLPLFLYNMPSHTKLVFEPETVRKAAELENIIGLKDSSGNMLYFHQLQELLKNHKDFSLLVGPEELLAESLFLGGNGGVSGGANIYPELYVNLYNAAKEKNVDIATRYHEQIMKIRTTIYSVGHYSSSFLKGVKCSLSCMGICDDFMAEPFRRFRESERIQIKKYLEELSLI